MSWNKNQFKKGMQSHSSPVDMDAIWKAIEPEVDLINKKRRKKRMLFFFFIGTAFLLGGTYLMLKQSQTSIPDAPIAIVSEFTKKKKPATLPDLHASPNLSPIFSPESNDLIPTSKSTQYTKTPKPKITKTPKQEITKTQSQKIETTKSTLVTTPSIVPLHSLTTLLSEKEDSLSFPPINVYDEKQPEQKKGISTAIGTYAGLAYAHKALRLVNAETTELLAVRQRTESSLETFQLGLQLELRHTSGWTFSTGIQQTQINERYEFAESLVETEMIWGLKDIDVNLFGDSTLTFGELPLTRTTITNQKIYNSLNLIDIPLLVGYYQKFGKWEGSIHTGLFTNLSLKTKGKIRHQGTWDINLKENQEQVFISNVGWSYYLGLSLQRPLTKHIALYFSPNLHYYPKDFTQKVPLKNYGLSQHYTIFGGKLGLRYRIGSQN